MTGTVVSATGALRAFNDAGVLAPVDIHVARRLAALVCEPDDLVVLAAAFAVRASRLGHVFTEPATLAARVAVDREEPGGALPWPEPAAWLAAVQASAMTAVGEESVDVHRPLRLLGERLYLDRYWRQERRLAERLVALRAGGRLAVVAGGPGTGKTTRVAGLLAELGPRQLVALAAPTGKAAARLQEAVRERAGVLQAPWLAETEAKTLHRLLGWRSGPSGGWRHHRGRRLPHDVVIIDEASMVSLTLMGRVADALRPGARLVLVGDPDQLTSVEAGAVLGDIVRAGGEAIEVLEQVHRFGPEIARLAAAVRDGDADAAVAALSAVGGAVEWVAADPADAQGAPGVVCDAVRAAGEAGIAAARAGDREAALGALERFRLLCAHRFGAHGVARWSAVAEGWLAGALDAHGEAFYVGRPLMVTRNDYDVRLFNGDTGVVVAGDGGRAVAVFDRGGELVEVAPSRVETVDTMYAMTIHKSQGSQFATVAVLLPPPESPVLTRELLYTAVTRARERLVVVGTEASVRAAVGRPVARASALAERLGGR